MCYKTGKYTVCRRVRAFFSPEILQAGAVKGLIRFDEAEGKRGCDDIFFLSFFILQNISLHRAAPSEVYSMTCT